jgi:F-type H+-transporting ATPase subunit c
MDFISYTNEIVQSSKFLGAALAMGFGAIGAGLGTFRSAVSAVQGMARQPKQDMLILRTMLITQAVTESASIFALVVACLLLFVPTATVTPDNYIYIASGMIATGFAMGLGAIGGGIGMGLTGEKAVAGVSRNPESVSEVQFVHLLGSAVAGNPSVFGLVVALLIFIFDYSQTLVLPQAFALMGAGISMGLGAIGCGIGCGIPGGAACEAVSKKPESRPVFVRTMLIGQAVSQSTSVYALVVAFLLLYVVK